MAPAYLLENIPGGKSWHGHLQTFLCYRSLKDTIRVLFTSVGLLKTAGRPGVDEDFGLCFQIIETLFVKGSAGSLLLHGADNRRKASSHRTMC